VNYYVSPESHAAKLTGQFGYSFNDTNAIFGSGGFIEGNTRNAFLGDQTEGEWAIIAQIQVVW
jgi:hypothetical protein